VLIVALYIGLAGRLAYVQCYSGARYREWATIIRSRDVRIPAGRGDIYDRAGRPLAITIQSASIFANRNEAGDRLPAAARRVASALGKDPSYFDGRLVGRGSILWLARRVDPRVWDRVRESMSGIRGIGMQSEPKRVYPSGQIAAQLIGFTNGSGYGAEGIEHSCNDDLRGVDGICRAELDAQRRIIPETRRQERAPRHGKSIYLTIDLTIQSIAESALAQMARTYKPKSACAVVMDPRTGEVLALANYPSFDPNAPGSKPDAWRNRAVADLYEPGSTLKTVTVAGALNEGYSDHAVYAHCCGSERLGHSTIRCSLHGKFKGGHGTVDMRRLIEESCNIGAAHIALRMGPDKLNKYHRLFGLVTRPDMGLGCEASARPIGDDEWSQIRLANVGFGQGVAVSALQMPGVYATIANHGVRMPPRIIRAVRDSNGHMCKLDEPGKGIRVISNRAARVMTDLLVGCVNEGTGKPAQIPGRTVAGKTGSAQVSAVGGYAASEFVASFMGFAPAYKPRLAIAVVVHKPQGSHFGATVAAPVFREIGEKALWYLRVPADKPVQPANPRKQDGDIKSVA
jgi:cell division protein FtsI/penicillin-binding protein 2